MSRLLVFAGTTEGRELAESAAALGIPVTASVATEYGGSFLTPGPRLLVHAGRLDEAQMASFVRDGGYALVVDATHPYAVEVSRNLRAACREADIPCLRLLRRPSDTSGCRLFASLAEAVGAAGAAEGNILAATGANQIALYRAVPDYRLRVWARVLPTEESVARCRAAGLPEAHILAARGPFSEEENERVLRGCAIRTLVTKDGGAEGGFPEKRAAALRCGAAVYAVRRPPEQGLTFEQVMDEIRRKFE